MILILNWEKKVMEVGKADLFILMMHRVFEASVIRPHANSTVAPRACVLEMRATALEQTLPNEGLAQEQFNVFFGPLPRGERLKKHHNLLEVHLPQLVAPFDKKSGTNVEMEGGEAIFFCLYRVSIRARKDDSSTYQISVPHPDSVFHRNFSHEETVHPAEAELDELDTLVLQMCCQISVNSGREIPQICNLSLNAGLVRDVIVLNAIQQLCQTPKRVCLDRIENRLG